MKLYQTSANCFEDAQIEDIQRTPYEGMGKPEPLKYDLSGLWARRIDREQRLVYQASETEIRIFSCRYHYD